MGGDRALRTVETHLASAQAEETNGLSLETAGASNGSLEGEDANDLSEEPEEEPDYGDEEADEGNEDEGNEDEETGSLEADDSVAEEGEMGSTPTKPPPIDFDAVHGMKKSKVWELVESREDALKDFQAMVKSRWHDHHKKNRNIRRDWKAVVAKFDSLRAASKADQADIDALAGRIKAQKNEIRKLKSLVYKLR